MKTMSPDEKAALILKGQRDLYTQAFELSKHLGVDPGEQREFDSAGDYSRAADMILKGIPATKRVVRAILHELSDYDPDSDSLWPYGSILVRYAREQGQQLHDDYSDGVLVDWARSSVGWHP